MLGQLPEANFTLVSVLTVKFLHDIHFLPSVFFLTPQQLCVCVCVCLCVCVCVNQLKKPADNVSKFIAIEELTILCVSLREAGVDDGTETRAASTSWFAGLTHKRPDTQCGCTLTRTRAVSIVTCGAPLSSALRVKQRAVEDRAVDGQQRQNKSLTSG